MSPLRHIWRGPSVHSGNGLAFLRPSTSSLRGCYYTAEDVGTRPVDIEGVFATTRFCTCTPPAVGGAGNPSPHTARGVVCAMEGALAHLGLGTLAGKSIVMQGTGNVGASMIGELLARDVASIVAPSRSSIHTSRSGDGGSD